MKEIRYLGPAHVLITQDGEKHRRGESFEVSDQEAEFMAESPHTWIEFVPERQSGGIGKPWPPPKSEPAAESGEGQATEDTEE